MLPMLAVRRTLLSGALAALVSLPPRPSWSEPPRAMDRATAIGETLSRVPAFVVTNSLCQGQQATELWPVAADRLVEIRFAHTSFTWARASRENTAEATMASLMRVALARRRRRPSS